MGIYEATTYDGQRSIHFDNDWDALLMEQDWAGLPELRLQIGEEFAVIDREHVGLLLAYLERWHKTGKLYEAESSRPTQAEMPTPG